MNRELLENEYNRSATIYTKSLWQLEKAREFLEELPLEPCWITLIPYTTDCTICLHFNPEQLADAARVLLPLCNGKLEKTVEPTGIRLKGTHGTLSILLLSELPGTCTIEYVEEEVEVPEVPAVPAHKEVKKRAVLTGDCDPLLKGE